jgi:carbonic anhydrase/acetyltransferase-like protein (isoleucine patch superfamily)
MMPLKYQKISQSDSKLYRIQALKSFGDVNEGDIGGFIESDENLSQDDDCWIYNDAKVYGQAAVTCNAKIKDSSEVYDTAMVTGDAVVAGSSKVFQKALVADKALIDGQALVYGGAEVFGNAKVIGRSKVHDGAWVYGDIIVLGQANITSRCTKTPIVLTGLEYDVTIMDDHISIDCQTKSFDEWRTITREEAYAMGGKTAMKFFKHIPDTLEFLVQKYRKKDSNV